MGPTDDSRPLRSVSDTAMWVAYYRAMETERPDALFRDPYARRLAGERGEQAVKALRRGRAMSAPMVVRTVAIDQLLARALAEGCDAVLNLAAGLDARPYRLELPATLQWREVDLPEIMEYKERQLAGEQPRCQLRRDVLDLGDRTRRQELFGNIAAQATKVVIITEGLLGYLDPEEVGRLAEDLRAQGSFAFWITDLASPMVRKRVQKHWGKQLKAANAPLKFAPEEGEKFFEPHGWCAVQFVDMLAESERINRPMPGAAIMRFIGKVAPGYWARQAKLWRSGMVLMQPCK